MCPVQTVTYLSGQTEVRIARSQGFAIMKNELNPGEINLSAPVFNSAGVPIGAVATASQIGDWSRDRLLSELAPSIVDAARLLSQHPHLATLATSSGL